MAHFFMTAFYIAVFIIFLRIVFAAGWFIVTRAPALAIVAVLIALIAAIGPHQ